MQCVIRSCVTRYRHTYTSIHISHTNLLENMPTTDSVPSFYHVHLTFHMMVFQGSATVIVQPCNYMSRSCIYRQTAQVKCIMD